MKDYRPELAEFLGVFALVFVGCAAIASNERFTFLGPLGVAIAFGFTVAILVYALGHVSGAHLNPAVTMAFAASGHFPWRRSVTYVLAQCGGATAAAFLLKLTLPDETPLGVVRPFETALGAAFVFEIVLTFLLMLVIMGVATDARAAPGSAGLAIGGAVLVGGLAGGGLSGAALNPARALGPALAADQLTHLWIYATAPVLGAILGAAAYEVLRRGRLAPARFTPDALGALGPVLAVEEDEGLTRALTPGAPAPKRPAE